MLQAPPGGRVLELPQRDRRSGARRARRPYRHGQLCHPQDTQDQGVARPPAALPRALHADFGIMDQSGRALVCRAHQKAAPARRSYFGQATASRHPRLHPPPQPKPKALQMDQVRRPNTRLGQALLPKNTDGVIGLRSCGLLKIEGAAHQADGETRFARAASSVRRRSAAWTILRDWTYRSRTRASALWTTRARSRGKLKLQASPKRCCKCCGVLLTVLNGSDWKLDRCRNGCSAHLVKQTYR